MKKVFYILVVILCLSCQEEGEVISGNFLYYADAAVLQTDNEVYGVIINTKMHELDAQVQQFKNEATDMVPVEIRAVIKPKPENEEGWDYRIEITEIINVFEPSGTQDDTIKIGN